MSAILLAALIVLLAAPVGAEFVNGNKLYEACQSNDTGYRDGFCLGFIQGVIDGLRGPTRGAGGFKFCPSPSVTGQQVLDVVKIWLTENPQHRHFNAVSLIAAALAKAWPCK